MNPLRWLLNRHAPILTDDQQNERLRRLLHAEADRMFPDPMWPGCNCERWDELGRNQPHRCPAHQRVGRHRAVWEAPLDDQPAAVIAAVVTDVKRRQP